MDRRHFMECGVGALVAPLVSNTLIFTKSDKKDPFKKAFIMKVDVKGNMNNRVYPREVMIKAINEFNSRGAKTNLGCIEMNTSGAEIKFNKVSHVVDKLYLEGDNIYADITPLDTPNGRILKSLKNINFRTRGVGNGHYDENQIFTVGENYKLISIDYTSDPETWGC